MPGRTETFTLVIPPNTPERAPYTVQETFDMPILVDGAAYFPDRCAGLVGARLLDRSTQFLPATGGRWLIGNAEAVPFHRPMRRLAGPPYLITFQGANLDTIDSRRIEFRLEMGQ